MLRAIPCSYFSRSNCIVTASVIITQPVSALVESWLQSALNRCTEWL